jgi:hypothetical protein
VGRRPTVTSPLPDMVAHTGEPPTTQRPFTEDDAEWVRRYVDDLAKVLCPRLEAHRARFGDWERVVQRVFTARDAVIAHGWTYFSAIDEAHNELCIAIGILESENPPATTVLYESTLSGTKRTIDFLVEYMGHSPCYIDVKTIAPRSRDRWDQYAKGQEEGWLPDHATVTLLKEWLGGELWHNMVAARSRMLEYTLELEDKVQAADLAATSDCIVLALCSNGFHWHEDELEDFVAFYVSGTHRPDDHFAQMERSHLERYPLRPKRAVRRFGYMERSSGAILPNRMNWNVVAPPMPFG